MRELDKKICICLYEQKREGIDLLFREYYKILVVWAATFLHNLGEAEDLVQDFFVKLLSSPPKNLLPPETLRAYLFTAVRNLAYNRLRIHDPLKKACDVACFEKPWEEYDDFEDELFRRVVDRINGLPPRTQEVVRSVYLEGMRYKEVAKKLDIAESTVNTLLVNALKKLRQYDMPKEVLWFFLISDAEKPRDYSGT